MVAVDAQILGGVAVTVLLALLFFGVVVLWDVALAIRGVADKLDKLEDTVDDDLTEMERAVSGAPGGGGPQVHLSGGGTITSGGSPRTQAGPHPSPRPDSPTGDPAADRGAAHADDSRTAAADASRSDSSSTPPEQAESTETTRESQDQTSEPESQRSRQSVGADPTPVRSAAETTDRSESTVDEGVEQVTESADEDTTAATDASPNRGRFITSPDRTPWYRTPLDWDAVVEGRSPIAGELEAGDIEPTPTVGSEDETDTADEPITVDPDGAATTETPSRDSQPAAERDVDETDETDDTDATDAVDDRNEDRPSPQDGPGSASEAESTQTADSMTETDPSGSSTMGTEATEPTDDDSTVTESGGDDAREGDVDETGADESDSAGDALAFTGDESSADRSQDVVEPVPSDDAIEPVEDEDDNLERDETNDPERANETDSERANENESQPDEEDDSPPDAEDGVQPEVPDESPDLEFTFEEFSPDDRSEPSLTVDDAVAAVNETEPSLSRSAHGVTASAEQDDDGVVLVYDLETTDAGESTTRLLSYQLKSFANESDVAVDVSVAGNRIVVDIPEAGGTDVSQWETAIVEVIDRTLYLSDSS